MYLVFNLNTSLSPLPILLVFHQSRFLPIPNFWFEWVCVLVTGGTLSRSMLAVRLKGREHG